MKYYKTINGIRAICEKGDIDGDQSSLVQKDWVEITKDEMLAITNPPKTPEQIAEEEAIASKIQKQLELDSIVVTTSKGNSFDGNETARNNMVSAIMSADLIGLTEAEWKLADNTVKTVTLDELKEALALAIQEVGIIVKKY